ncbi:steroid 5-alpha reductase family enzyme [Microbacterium endophyticum]|uniref:Steroid 5-alpha reductase family enzyme n=1 Tax=Microbacterium endophyticum TaxID=1526412 RepID=A0A7W4YM85_9MICO|nr:DUF1295 domain-containing protein [Microbacterium endophyticum]MBB2975938.1 steroid 5-alpha reductase family enzyme [Microbacterium endophyticum]NIK37693.1 steroid 5-alpha reductase family enzyme [Microbacterium endophyticum]
MDKQKRASLIAVIVAVLIGALTALAGSQGGELVAGVPLFALAVAAAFLIQVLVYVPSAALKTERFFDLTGSLTFIIVSLSILLLSPSVDARSVVLAVMVIVWAIRLGSFLFVRIHKSGSDDRFDELKTSKIRFLRVWVLQGLWVSLTAAAAWIAMSSASDPVPVGWIEVIGIGMWVLGLGIEIAADWQKAAFKADSENEGSFIRSGLWSRSRHPNYFGEIVLWIGVAIVAAPALVGWQWVALISPLFVVLLLTKVSGVPLLEAKADNRWGGQRGYENYKSRTPVLIPRLRP